MRDLLDSVLAVLALSGGLLALVLLLGCALFGRG